MTPIAKDRPRNGAVKRKTADFFCETEDAWGPSIVQASRVVCVLQTVVSRITSGIDQPPRKVSCTVIKESFALSAYLTRGLIYF